MKFQSTKILIILIVCNLFAVTGYYFLFHFIVTETQSSSNLINAINVSEQKNSRLGSLRAIIKETESQRQQLAIFLLPKDSEITFIGQIESLATKSGLESKTNNISASDGVANTSNNLSLQVGTTGTWSNTMYFMSQIENLPYDIHVQGFMINRTPITSGGYSSSWTATFDINVTESI